MQNDTRDEGYSPPQIRDLGSFTKVTQDGSVPKVGSTSDGFTALGLGTGDLPKLP